MNLFRALSPVAATLALAACSSPPSDAEARAALKKMIIGATGQQADGMVENNLKDVKVSDCTKAESKGYWCEVTTGMSMGVAKRMRFEKSDSGWVVAN